MRCAHAAVAAVGLLVSGLVHAQTVTLAPVKDTTLYFDTLGNTSNGAGDSFFAGDNNGGDIRRGLVQFDLTSIAPGSTINSATLTLNMTRTRAGSVPVSLHRASASWGEGASVGSSGGGGGAPALTGDATWLHRFYDTQLWAAPGGDFALAASATTSVGGIGAYSWSSAAMLADVQGWVNVPSTNFGWAVRGGEGSAVTAKRFASRENATVSIRPRLVINYTPPVDAGACCFANGTCLLYPPVLCASQGGVFQGIGTGCTPNPCPQPTGACCLPGLICQVLTQAQCIAQLGTYQGDNFSCSPNPCTLPTGACCFPDSTCQVLRADQCATQNGVYRGDGVPCSAGLCPLVLTPFVDALPIPAIATPTTGFPGTQATYTIAVKEVSQRLHRDLPLTRVWGYDGKYPGPTIEAYRNQRVDVTWVNDLRDETGQLRLHHYLPVDLCLHGPNMHGDACRIVTHLHGGFVPPASDGYPETTIVPGEQSTPYYYPNTQQAATLWYHDHALGITRLNVYMGLAGFYILRDSVENGLGLPAGQFEVGLAIQDRSFNADGTLKYPGMWDEHYFGDFMLVNGKVWPFLNVAQGKYRFRALNGCNSRTLRLALSNGAPIVQIGSDGGLLAAPVARSEVLLQPGERADVIIDFAGYAPGTQIVLTNSAPAPFPGEPGVGVIPNVMRFNVVAGAGFTGPIPSVLRPVTALQPADASVTREFTLRKLPNTCPDSMWMINDLGWDDITERPRLETTEIWSFINKSGFSHPMHMHLVQFQVLDRQPFEIIGGQVVPTGPAVPRPAEEGGWKDTVRCDPFEITRVIARFDGWTGLYPYHCHVLEHEDNEMMRQYDLTCYANCDGSSVPPVINVNDYVCFINSFASGSPYANCDHSTLAPVLNVNDYICFMGKVAAGCQ